MSAQGTAGPRDLLVVHVLWSRNALNSKVSIDFLLVTRKGPLEDADITGS